MIFDETLNENNINTKNKTVNESNSSTKNETVNESNSAENETVNESKRDYKSDYESNYKSDYEGDNEGDNSTKKDTNYFEIKTLNNWFKTIDQTKSLEELTELLKSENFLYEYWSLKYYNNNKDLNYRIFNAKAGRLFISFNKKIFEKVYGCNFTALVEKLINTVDKKENQTIVNDIKYNKNKIYGEYKFDEDVVKHKDDLCDLLKLF